MQPTSRALAANVAGALVLAGVVDGAVAVFGWGAASDARGLPGAPPGIVVGGVWLALFGLMGAARAFVLASRHPQRRAFARGIACVLVFCALYPFYTGGLAQLRVAELGNVATLVTVTILAVVVRRASPRAATLLTPAIAWLAFATALVGNALVRRI